MVVNEMKRPFGRYFLHVYWKGGRCYCTSMNGLKAVQAEAHVFVKEKVAWILIQDADNGFETIFEHGKHSDILAK